MVLGLLLAKAWTASSSGLEHGVSRPAPTDNCAHYSLMSGRLFALSQSPKDGG
jgi:hypothetical protein